MIEAGLVSINGTIIKTPYTLVTKSDHIIAAGKKINLSEQQTTSLWLYHKPKGVLVSNHDADGRTTIFDLLPQDMPRVMSVGRLDYNSEGLLLLTNNGSLSREMELPQNQIVREYRCRHDQKLTSQQMNYAANGLKIDNVKYDKMIIKYPQQESESTKRNHWCNVSLHEGKNREIRNIFLYFGANVSRLIRTKYGPFELGNLKKNCIMQIDNATLQNALQNMNLRFQKVGL